MCWELSWEGGSWLGERGGKRASVGEQHVQGSEEGQEKDSEGRVRESGEKMKTMD